MGSKLQIWASKPNFFLSLGDTKKIPLWGENQSGYLYFCEVPFLYLTVSKIGTIYIKRHGRSEGREKAGRPWPPQDFQNPPYSFYKFLCLCIFNCLSHDFLFFYIMVSNTYFLFELRLRLSPTLAGRILNSFTSLGSRAPKNWFCGVFQHWVAIEACGFAFSCVLMLVGKWELQTPVREWNHKHVECFVALELGCALCKFWSVRLFFLGLL